MNESRRKFLKTGSLIALGGLSMPFVMGKNIPNVFSNESLHAPFTLPPLPYETDALEPFIDKLTMEIHHGKHHKAYVDNLNKAMDGQNIRSSLDEIVRKISSYSDAIRNNAGGHWNHTFFWKVMKPGGSQPPEQLVRAIDEAFGSMDAFKKNFEDAGSKRFGSGWAWLVVDSDKKLVINSTPNQDNPLMDLSPFRGRPLLGIDVWEHAYYLKYQNKRAEYLRAWWNVVNWEEVNSNLLSGQ